MCEPANKLNFNVFITVFYFSGNNIKKNIWEKRQKKGCELLRMQFNKTRVISCLAEGQ
jgi:hypothetical protein